MQFARQVLKTLPSQGRRGLSLPAAAATTKSTTSTRVVAAPLAQVGSVLGTVACLHHLQQVSGDARHEYKTSADFSLRGMMLKVLPSSVLGLAASCPLGHDGPVDDDPNSLIYKSEATTNRQVLCFNLIYACVTYVCMCVYAVCGKATHQTPPIQTPVGDLVAVVSWFQHATCFFYIYIYLFVCGDFLCRFLPDVPRGNRPRKNYAEYLNLYYLLDIQRDDEGISSDEQHFITVHQIFELWFKLIIRELSEARDILIAGFVPEEDVPRVVHKLTRLVGG